MRLSVEFSYIDIHLTREPADFLLQAIWTIEDLIMDNRMHRLALGFLMLTSLGLSSGCSHPHQSTHYHSKHRAKLSYLDFTPLNEEKVQRKQVVKKALSLLDGRVASSHGHRFDSNPLGFVRSAYWEAGVELLSKPAELGERGLENLLRSAEERRQIFHGTPRPGDLVLFKSPRTSSVAAESRSETRLGHVAIVEEILTDGTLELVGRFRRGPARFKINIQQASALKTTNGVFINDVVKLDEEFPGGELFYAFMDPWS